MGADDKIDIKADDLKGKAKEGMGHATHDDGLKAEGKADQSAADVRGAGEKIKDAFKH